jgi:uracil-DNA glycosylase
MDYRDNPNPKTMGVNIERRSGVNIRRRLTFREHLPNYFPLPHPSWRSTGWMKRNPWFEIDLLPQLQELIDRRK